MIDWLKEWKKWKKTGVITRNWARVITRNYARNYRNVTLTNNTRNRFFPGFDEAGPGFEKIRD